MQFTKTLAGAAATIAWPTATPARLRKIACQLCQGGCGISMIAALARFFLQERRVGMLADASEPLMRAAIC